MNRKENTRTEPKFSLRPASPDEAGLFYAPLVEQGMVLGVVGHLGIGFGYQGKEFWHTWWPRNNEKLNSLKFKAERENSVDEPWDKSQEHGLTEAGKEMLRNAADNTLPHSYSWFVFQDYNTPGEKFTSDLTLPEAIRLYNETDSGSKRLGVTKDEIATVDLAITLTANKICRRTTPALPAFPAIRL